MDRRTTDVKVQDENGRENVYVPLRPLIEGMGLTWSPQLRRIKRNLVLDEVCTNVTVTVTEQNRNRNIKMMAIPISHLNGLLFGVNANRVIVDCPLALDAIKHLNAFSRRKRNW